jgi:DNA-binding SARP family transcriptional activator
MLAIQAGQVVSQAAIIDGLWADKPPGNPSSSIYTYVNGLRRALDPDRDSRSSSMLESVSLGYRLRGDELEVDVAQFAERVTAGRGLSTVNPSAALSEFDAALGIWRGDPLTGVSGPFVQATRLQLLEQRFDLMESRATAMLALGRQSTAIAELRELVGDYPLRERPRGLLMLALHRNGQVDEALAVFADLRGVLSSELGIDPSPSLRELRDRLVRREPSLMTGPLVQIELVAPGRDRPQNTPAQLPLEVSAFTGRHVELERLRSLLAPKTQGAPGDRRSEAPLIGVISGPAGVGKTSLVVRIAHEFKGQFPDGQLFLNMRGFDPHEPPINSTQALTKLIGSLGDHATIPRESEAELSAYFRSMLSGKRMLIVLDNVLSSEQIRPLLPGSSSAVLVASRNRLDGLVARDGARVLDLRPFRPEESSVFLTRLSGSKRTAGTEHEVRRIADLCGHLPLALGIVARRLAIHPGLRPSAVVAELSGAGDRLTVLDSGSGDGGAIQSVFSWSYQALKPEPAEMFRRLGLYPGGGTSVWLPPPH